MIQAGGRPAGHGAADAAGNHEGVALHRLVHLGGVSGHDSRASRRSVIRERGQRTPELEASGPNARPGEGRTSGNSGHECRDGSLQGPRTSETPNQNGRAFPAAQGRKRRIGSLCWAPIGAGVQPHWTIPNGRSVRWPLALLGAGLISSVGTFLKCQPKDSRVRCQVLLGKASLRLTGKSSLHSPN